MKKIKSTSTDSTLKDKIRGCLLGVAIGDALGAPFEHVLPGETNQTLDNIGGYIKDFHPYWRYPAGSWTDDTGMTLATCRAFIETLTTNKSMEECFKDAFEAWSTSQECRRPGKTVLYAAKFGESDVNSWANGALMRISPVAVYSYLRELNLHEASELAYKIARLTHGHPYATFPAVSCVDALLSILHGEEEVPGFAYSGTKCGESVIKDPAAKMIYYTSDYEPKYKGPIENLPATTGLWMWRNVIENCLGLKRDRSDIDPLKRKPLYWADLPEFENGILHTVNNSFDRDTAGAIAGAILGTYWGESGIPKRWKEQVEKADLIRDLADRLIELCLQNKSGPSLDTMKYKSRFDNREPEPVTLLMSDVSTFEFEGKTFVNANPPQTLKAQYEKAHGIVPEPGWELLTWKDRYTIKRGDIIRSYIRAYRAPDEIFFKEYPVKSAPYIRTLTYYRIKGMKSEVVELYGNSGVTTQSIFDNAEVWIKRS